MTTEQKAKAYDEALEKAKSMIDNFRKGEATLAASELESIFPELCESEDEKIRKELLKHCTNAVNGVTMCVSTGDYARWLAWLEKQEKPKHSFLQDAFDKSKKYTLDDKKEASEYSESILPTSIAYGESEEEYKLHTIMEAAFIAGQRKLKPTYYGNSIYCRISEQKPAWSYEDKANLDNIIWLCNNCINGSETTWIPSQATKIKHLIEAIKERGLPPQKLAWSEEDESMLNDVINYFSIDTALQHSEKDMLNWLKSLKKRIGE